MAVMLFEGPVRGAAPLRPSTFLEILYQCSACDFTSVRYFDVEHHVACAPNEACRGARVLFERRRVAHAPAEDGGGGGGDGAKPEK